MPTYLMQEYIGGRGMCDIILFDEIDPRIDALSPDNKLIFLPQAPLLAPVRRQRAASSFPLSPPLSNCVSSPCCGGYFGANLKYSGYDLLIIEGKSPEPVYISIHNDEVNINPAGHLWGKKSSNMVNMICAEMQTRYDLDNFGLYSMGIANIGPAGEGNEIRLHHV